MVDLLPELNTLKIHSLSLYEPRMLNSEELITLSSLEDTSKITKVYLEKMNEIEELQRKLLKKKLERKTNQIRFLKSYFTHTRKKT